MKKIIDKYIQKEELRRFTYIIPGLLIILAVLALSSSRGEASLYGLEMIIFEDEDRNHIESMEVFNKYHDIEDVRFDYAKDGFYVLNSDDEFLYGTIGGNKLYKTKGLNEERYLLEEFENSIVSMEILDNKNILLCTTKGRWSDEANSEIYLSSNEGLSFKKVLDLKTGDAFHWNYAHDKDGYVFISEYGKKTIDENARRIYRSKDWGETFECVYEPEKEEGYHNHKVHIDKKDKNKIYQIIGDDNKRMLVSKDRGDTWDTLWWGDYHPTSMVDLGDEIVFGLDGAPFPGIVKFDKRTEEITEKLRFKKPEKGGSTYAMIEHEGVIYAGFMSYGEAELWDGSIYSSEDDGETWKIFESFDKLEEDMGVGIHKFVAKGSSLFINVQLPYKNNEGELKHYFGTIKLF